MLILGIPGSLRAQSINAGLLRAAGELTPDGVAFEFAQLKDIPFYDGDRERDEGNPAPVEKLRERIAAADALLIATPEYNGGYPGLLKNALDWASRPYNEPSVFAGKPVGTIGASPGMQGTQSAQASLLPVFRNLRMVFFSGQGMYVGGAHRLFDENGDLTDGPTRERIATYLQKLCAFAARNGQSQ